VFPAGGRVQTWIDSRRRGGAQAIFFLTEHGRLGALRNELVGAALTPLTAAQDNNKFVLVNASFE
jgi:hypothetical protein